MKPSDAPVGTWDREYREIRSIPSSMRSLPSKALLLFERLLDFGSLRNVLDAGCGNGRNAIFLALKGCNVAAVDFSLAALEAVTTNAEREGLSNRIAVACADLRHTLPFKDDNFELSLDSYVSCHFTDEADHRHYWSELSRVTRPGGHIFTSVFSPDDEYYRSAAALQNSPMPFVTDPVNGITKRIYGEEEFKSLFAPPLSIAYFVKFQFSDRVIDRDYMRSLFVAVLRKVTNSERGSGSHVRSSN